MNHLFLAGLALVLAIPVCGQDDHRLRRELSRYMERITTRGFSGAVLVAKGGKVILAEGYGSLGAKGGKVTKDSVFDVASVTKQFTAATILKLEMQEKLSTADRVDQHLPGVPKDKAAITIHHLLTHTAGIPNNVGGDYDLGRFLDEDAVIIVLSNSTLSAGVLPIDFAPGVLEKILFGEPYTVPPASVKLTESQLRAFGATYALPSGSTLSVAPKNGGLALEAQGRDAVSLLMYPDADVTPTPLTARISAAFDAMSRGDFDPLAELAGPEVAPDHLKRFPSFWADWESKLGRYKNSQLLFTRRIGSRDYIYFQLNFEKGNSVVRAGQSGSGNFVFSRPGVPTKASFLAVPVSSNQFSYFDFRSGSNVPIHFQGERAEMVVHRPKDKLRFKVKM